MGEERRGEFRSSVRERIPVHYPDYEPLIRDLSLSGAFIQDKRPFRMGQTLRLRLPLENGPIDILAMVRHMESGMDMGVEFLEMNYSAREQLRLILARASAPEKAV